MTLSSLISYGNSAVPSYDFTPSQGLDRIHWKGGGWKGGKGNPHAALSALTLLAFLFFLNILQNCLKDTIGHNNGMLVMVLPANSTATRIKRDVSEIKSKQEENSATDFYQNWTDLQISNLNDTQVESYWSDEKNKARKRHSFYSFQKKIEQTSD